MRGCPCQRPRERQDGVPAAPGASALPQGAALGGVPRSRCPSVPVSRGARVPLSLCPALGPALAEPSRCWGRGQCGGGPGLGAEQEAKGGRAGSGCRRGAEEGRGSAAGPVLAAGCCQRGRVATLAGYPQSIGRSGIASARYGRGLAGGR